MAGKRFATSKISKDRPEGESSPPPSDGEETYGMVNSRNAPIHGRKFSRPSKSFGNAMVSSFKYFFSNSHSHSIRP